MYPGLYDCDADVIVIGAGLSGLTAAYTLLEKEPNLSVMILEANDRIGGRLSSIPLLVGNGNEVKTYDLGGQWVSTAQTHLLKLLHKLDIQLHKPGKRKGKTIGEFQTGGLYTSRTDPPVFGTTVDRFAVFRFFVMMEKLSEKVTFLNPTVITDWEIFDSVSMEYFIMNNISRTVPQETVKHFIRTACGADPARISVLYYLAFCNGTHGISNQCMRESGREAWIKGGAQEVCQRLATKINRKNVYLSEPVLHIRRNDYYVTVETENETYSCSSVILAIPPPEILKINFTPPLPTSKTEVLQTIITCHVIKFIATYEKQFWKAKGFSGDIINRSNGIIFSCHDVTIDNKAALIGYILPEAKSIQRSQRKEMVLNELERYFGYGAMSPLEYREKLWCGQKSVGQCFMCHANISTMQKYHQIRRPIGRLFWAGTETATCWPGFMEGAVHAGQRAAYEVLYDMRPGCLTVSDISEITAKPKQINKYKDTLKARMVDWRYILSTTVLIFLIWKNKRSRRVSVKLFFMGKKLVGIMLYGTKIIYGRLRQWYIKK